ncbi:MAG: glycerophosphodiester phosphodiesterase family protein [Pirellulales bacterium]
MSVLIAHRGASFDAPENTLPSFQLAWEQDADGIEGDFMLTADGEIVSFHDTDTQRLAGEPGLVKESTLAELRALDVGRWKGGRWALTRIPTLREVLEGIPAGKKLVAELKDGPEIVEPFGRVIEASTFNPDDLLIITLVDETAAECRRQLPRWKRHWLSGYKQDDGGRWRPDADEVIATIERVGAAGFGSLAKPDHFDGAFVDRLRTAGIAEFHVWTVDDPEVARFYERLGAWGITTNRPRFIREHLEQQ